MSATFTKDRAIISFRTATSGGPLAPRYGVDWHARWIMVFLAVGIAARLIRYLLRFPLWGDEAMLAMNFLDRDYAGLMQPLDFHQVAPLLFLWIELTAVKLLGFHEWSLRLFPLLCSIASLFLFHRLAKLLLRGTALVLAVGIFAVTYSGLRYAAEMKPYSGDLMFSSLLLLLAVRWWRQPDDTRWLWALAAAVPLALGLSYPAVFVAGGVSLAVAAVLLGTRSRRGWWAWAAFNLALAGSFLAWYRLAIGTQAGAELNVMARMWDETFPPRDSLLEPVGMAAAGPRRAAAGRAGRRRPLGKHRHDTALPRRRGSADPQGPLSAARALLGPLRLEPHRRGPAPLSLRRSYAVGHAPLAVGLYPGRHRGDGRL